MKQLPFNWKYDLLPGGSLLSAFLVALLWPGWNQWIDPESLEQLLEPGMTKSECVSIVGFDFTDKCRFRVSHPGLESCTISDSKRYWNLRDPQHDITLYFEEGLLQGAHVIIEAGLISEETYRFSNYSWHSSEAGDDH